MKKCSACGRLLSRSDFYPNRSHAGGISNRCRACCKIYNHEHYLRVRTSPAYQCRAKEYARKWHLKNRERRNPLIAQRDKDLRNQCIQYYGKNCVCCGENRREFLSIDHINGGGNQHRQKIGNKTWRWLIKNNFPPGFRVLCHNCNQSLGYNGYCPHQTLSPSNGANEFIHDLQISLL